MKRTVRLISIICVFVILSLSLISCFPIIPDFGEPINLELSGEPKMTWNYDEQYHTDEVIIDGVAENTLGKDVSNCFVMFTLYDSDGNVLDTAEAYLSLLKAGEKWRFCAYGSVGYEPASFELTELYCYE
jgi:hypothetical protein